MILTRLGNKTRIADKIYCHFPPHETYIEMFFGAGGMFFNKPRAKYNIVNDLDSEVFNLWQVVKFQPDALKKEMELLPWHQTVWDTYKKTYLNESDNVLRAALFLMYSNFGYMGKPNTMRVGPNNNTKKLITENIEATMKVIQNVVFLNDDFRDVLGRISLPDDKKDKDKIFVYCDPPYLDTDNNYQSGFTKDDTADLFKILVNSGLKFALSEFDHDFIIGQAEQYKLNVKIIGDRINLKNVRTEILVTNYQTQNTLF